MHFGILTGMPATGTLRIGLLPLCASNNPMPAVLWDNMVKGCAPIQMMKKSIMSVRGESVEPHPDSTGEELWREKENLALAWLEETLPTPLTSDAWLGAGVK